jgi:predicted ATPase/DNA-binding CsgD family transcriptional regulator
MGAAGGTSDEALVEPLTRREREILGQLAQGLTAPEISHALTLALSTVKWHLDHIYGKLGANSKREALSRARALGLVGPNGTAVSPAAPVPPAPRHNLPVQVTRFFGRDDEIERIAQRLADDRLVTLTGPGGVGKTRLALRAAEALLEAYADGVWLVELAALTDARLVAQQIAASLNLKDDPGRPSLELLTQHLRGRHLLLVLDNCEHLLASCAGVCAALLRACPELRVLACSREPLGAEGEAIFQVPSLPVPTTAQPSTPQAISEFPSVRLFVDRARLARPDYQVAEHNAAAIAEICQQVDGIPLAIEMAAARVHLLSAEQIAGRLNRAFDLLTAGKRTALPRQHTLRATIDWSYQLLSAEEGRLLQRVSVFAGGFTLEAAEAVCAGDGVPVSHVLDLLAGLVSKSMVVAERTPGDSSRYRLLEMVRQYAREKLDETRTSNDWHRRHRDYFLAYAEANHPKLGTNDHDRWRPILAEELDNYRQALDWAFGDTANPGPFVRLLRQLNFEIGFRHQEALDWFTRCLAQFRGRSDVPALLYIEVMYRAGGLTTLNDPPAGARLVARAVEVARAQGPDGREMLLQVLGCLARITTADLGEPERAVVFLEEADGIQQSLAQEPAAPTDELEARAAYACSRALVANWQRRYLDAIPHARTMLQYGEVRRDPLCTASGHTLHGIASLGLGNFGVARRHFLAALDINRRMHGWEIAYNLRWLAAVDLGEGNLERAHAFCRESLVEADLIPDRNIIASNLGLLASIHAKQGQPELAARLAGASAALYARQKRKPWEDASLETLLPGWREGPNRDAIQAAYDAGLAMSSDEAMAYALADDAT